MHSLGVGFKIAVDNGLGNLYDFLRGLWLVNPNCKVNLVGHSMGCVVIEALIGKYIVMFEKLPPIKSIHLLGSPIPVSSVVMMSHLTFVGKVVNYYNPYDEVIKEGDKEGLPFPSCLYKINRSKVVEKRAYAKDHRFKSYVKVLRSFP